MQTASIGNLTFVAFEDEQPESWTLETDSLRQVEMLGSRVHRLVWWSGRVSYVVESNGMAIELALADALEVSRLIAADEPARRTQRI
ncbi:hypothetical protein LL998_34080 (plasmid) [Burkholderia ambifaria]|uniref:hypothetical protein n=1 Tax=Burkholderia ambifaria TaxID=152480 RepID=UPI001E35B425|nr:hypothetical protein [Burkholderia ambifaria]UEP39770.1 hypothetical protein LL998_34080 [Burkholderia ambifaria]